MIEYRSECVGCPPERGCLGASCKNLNVPVLICDDCGDEDNDLWYGDDGNMYCKFCITSHLEKVMTD